jgi:oligopeptide transport system ATP-binding protein
MACGMPSIRTAGQRDLMTTLLDVKDLKTRFHTPEGTVYAVNGISFHVDEGETLAVVGESGCGKSVSMLSVLQLILVPPGEIAGGIASYRGQDLLKKSDREMERIRGQEIAMIFQDPMTSLNPVLTIGKQITESLRVHMGMDQKAADGRAVELLEMVGISDPSHRLSDYPHLFSGGMRQGCIQVSGLRSDLHLLFNWKALKGPHIVKAVGQLDKYHAHIFRKGKQHFPEVLRLHGLCFLVEDPCYFG